MLSTLHMDLAKCKADNSAILLKSHKNCYEMPWGSADPRDPSRDPYLHLLLVVLRVLKDAKCGSKTAMK